MCSPEDAVLAAQADRLSALVGRRLTGAWTVWIERVDEWFADMPVVLQFDDGTQLEVCWQKLDDLTLSWNTTGSASSPSPGSRISDGGTGHILRSA